MSSADYSYEPLCFAAARATILINVRTATPVGPFALYGFASSLHAVPAMSRWAQETPSANSLRKAAAVIVPAFLPPTFLISAMSDLICLEYSLSSGSCQNFSPDPLACCSYDGGGALNVMSAQGDRYGPS